MNATATFRKPKFSKLKLQKKNCTNELKKEELLKKKKKKTEW